MKAGLWLAVGVAGTLGAALVARSNDGDRCAPGFVAAGARCCPAGASRGGHCIQPAQCPQPLRAVAGGCDAPDERLLVEATRVLLGPSDWEAQGVVAPRIVAVEPFALDRFELTVHKAAEHLPGRFPAELARGDLARAAYGLTAEEASALCAARGGRLPTADEWVAAAAGPANHRYPWGDTGAVCRRAAWGLVRGPCAAGADGPDTVGARGLHRGFADLAGNIDEWVVLPSSGGFARAGGSYRTELVAALRTWAAVSAPSPDTGGVRCAYDAGARPGNADGPPVAPSDLR